MKFRNLLGVTSCLLIAFSGASYSQSSLPSFSPPPPKTPFVAPIIPLTGVTGGAVGGAISDLTRTENTGETESNDDRSLSSLDKIQGNNSGIDLVNRFIDGIASGEISDAVENGKDLTLDLPHFNEFKEVLIPPGGYFEMLVVEYLERKKLGLKLRVSEAGEVLLISFAQRVELSLRSIKARLLIAENNPNTIFNKSKINAVDKKHEKFVKILNDAEIPLLQVRKPG
jgi:hypothetical protein